jgi:hypothetical protein
MSNKRTSKLTVNRETLRLLDPAELDLANGGVKFPPSVACRPFAQSYRLCPATVQPVTKQPVSMLSFCAGRH